MNKLTKLMLASALLATSGFAGVNEIPSYLKENSSVTIKRDVTIMYDVENEGIITCVAKEDGSYPTLSGDGVTITNVHKSVAAGSNPTYGATVKSNNEINGAMVNGESYVANVEGGSVSENLQLAGVTVTDDYSTYAWKTGMGVSLTKDDILFMARYSGDDGESCVWTLADKLAVNVGSKGGSAVHDMRLEGKSGIDGDMSNYSGSIHVASDAEAEFANTNSTESVWTIDGSTKFTTAVTFTRTVRVNGSCDFAEDCILGERASLIIG